MEVQVAGENIDPAEFHQGGWADIRRRQRIYLDARNGSLQTPASKNPQVSRDARNRPARRNPPASPLPETDIKIVLRPRGGLDLRSVAQASLADAIFQKANLPQNPEDQIRPTRSQLPVNKYPLGRTSPKILCHPISRTERTAVRSRCSCFCSCQHGHWSNF